MAEQTGQGRAALAALTGAGLIGFAPIAIRLSEVGPHATNMWRFLFALPILAALAAAMRPIPTHRQTGWLLFAGVLFGVEISLWAAALGYTTVTNATLLTNLTPIFAALFGWIFFKERLGLTILAGGAVALTGAVTLAFARTHAAAGPEGDQGWIGDLLGFTSAIGYAGYLLIVRSLGKNVSVGAVMFWATLSAAFVAFGASISFNENMVPQTWIGWANVIFLGIVVQVGGQGLIAYGVGRLPIVISTVLLWMQPLVAAALSWIMFGEALGPIAMVGAILILAGIYTVQSARK